MHETPIPILAKAPLYDIQVNVANSGLCIGDNAEISLDKTGKVVVSALLRCRFLGVLPTIRRKQLGHLGPVIERILAPLLDEGRDLRVRIVGITPEYLAGQFRSEVFVSIWGVPRPVRRMIQGGNTKISSIFDSNGINIP